MKKTVLLILCFALISLGIPMAVGAVSWGTGTAVLCRDIQLIKSGLRGQKMCFCEADFKQTLGVPNIKKIKILSLPAETDGTLMLGETKVCANEIIKRRSIGALCFIPASANVTEASFTFCVPGLASDEAIECKLRFVDYVNAAPSATEPVSLLTQSGIPVFGELGGSDPEGDEIEFILLSYPKNGTLTLTDKRLGTYRYTPSSTTVGKDSFSYVIRDSFGNYSTVCEASVKIDSRMSQVTYVDMIDSNAYVAAVTLDALGVMHGVADGENMLFSPEGKVSRAEFVCMAMKIAGVETDESVTETYFDDNGDIPAEYSSCVAEAQKRGIVNGTFAKGGLYFRPNDNVTGLEASVILSRIVGTDAQNKSTDASVPAWARDEVQSVTEKGLLSADKANSQNGLTREDVAGALYALAKYLEK